MDPTTASSELTVRDLRRRWKPHKERLGQHRSDHPTLIRFHRACSWLARVEQMDFDRDADFALISQWIAFNSLYGQWDCGKNEPLADRECWRVFLDRILILDQDRLLPDLLRTHKPLVLTLLDDPYLSGFFWRDPDMEHVGPARRDKHSAATWYLEKNWTLILDRVMDRVYLLRCQLVHGAATYGGKLNRTSLRHCVWMLQHLVHTILLVLIDHGVDEDWGIMCYPPVNRSGRVAAGPE